MDTFWGLIGAADRAAMLRAGVMVEFAPGAVICHQGDPTQSIMVVFSGLVRVSTVSAAGEETVWAVRGAGEILGEMAAVDGRPRSATLTALDNVSGLLISGARLAALGQTRPRIAWAMLQIVVSRSRAAGNQQELRSGPALHRVAAVLLDVAHRDVLGASHDLIASVPLTQRELAGIAGISRETLVRVLKVLRERGIIETRRNHITILREDELRLL
ncbi:Crp/Fnr family transcriptional regulator [Lentzea sp. NBRC 105346]|uniref:Crp/Fnr family transcriptional regulator n=1 Tax=Lentzea sp. NBRC 105346 TaxID=3032205 RepID=UPI0024A3FDD8|nr:Crp/Fnr family transcriptional regulator [Lentzea sp. NBRC 105346]GLZ29781.1 Crp/Fnr family transcriptional regulator [Lentzea sp. NBRC 105346]